MRENYTIRHYHTLAIIHDDRQVFKAVHKPLAELAEVCGISGATDAEKADNFITWIEETNRKMGLPNSFDAIQEKDIDQMITWARKEAHPLYPLPVIWSREELRQLIESIRG